MIEVSIVKIVPDLTAEQFEKLLKHVSPEKSGRIVKYHFFRDAQNALVGDILARTEICRRTGLSNNQLSFFNNEYGKPFLTNNSHIHYNISHSANYVVCALDDESVGIDIEEKKAIDIKIAERFFASDEVFYILDAQPEYQNNRFFEVWTKKESHIKWEGRGLSKPLPSFSVFSVHDNPKLYYHCIYEDEKVIAHACTTKSEAPVIKLVSILELSVFFDTQRN